MRLPPILLACLSLVAPLLAAEEATPSAGLKVLSAGHSFHVWMPPLVEEMAKAAKIEGHKQLAISSIGGSQVIQHWNLPEGKNKAKPILEAGTAELFTMAPTFLPDDGIENFVKLGLAHNPKIRFTLQQNWVPFDDAELWLKRIKTIAVDRDTKTLAELKKINEPYFKLFEDHIGELNKKIPEAKIVIVPCGVAVLALRDLVIKGEVPGVAKQSELFTDALGHPQVQIRILAAYCHFAVIYKRNPKGLPVPASLAKQPEAEKLNRILQDIAWKAVTEYPMSGVSK